MGLRGSLTLLLRRGRSGLVWTLARLYRRNNLGPLERWVEDGFGRRLGRALRRLRRCAFWSFHFGRPLQSLFTLARTTLFFFTSSLRGQTLRFFLCFQIGRAHV